MKLHGTGSCVQVPSPLQASLVQEFASSHEYGVPAQAPPEQVSVAVQAFPSLHEAALLV